MEHPRPCLSMGSKLGDSIVGQAPDLNLGKNKDLTYSTDFRQVYATVLDHWLDCDSRTVLGQEFQPLPII